MREEREKERGGGWKNEGMCKKEMSLVIEAAIGIMVVATAMYMQG